MKKTNAARLLDSLEISYQLLEYQADENKLGAEHVALELGIDLKQIFKTMVLRGNKEGVFVCCIPGSEELNLKAAAKLTKNKKVELIPAKEVLTITGYLRGGCSPLAMRKEYPTFLDKSALEQEYIIVSAGLRGLQIQLDPQDLIRATKARVETLT